MFLVGLTMALPAEAVPSFARQTGEACSACHVGSFGPQLTPYGQKFKLAGYTYSNGQGGKIPLSGMLVESYTHTSKDQSADAGKGFDNNDNLSLQELSLFLAGGLNDHIGGFAQVTHAEPDRKTALDNVDLRFATPMHLAGKDSLLGITLNNNPTVQDAFNSVPAWRFPYMASELVPGSAASPLLDGGLAQQVAGITAYTVFDNKLYVELGGYRSLSSSFLDNINVADEAGRIDGVAPYWRLAYMADVNGHAFNVGLLGMNTHLQPGRLSGPTDKYADVGVDASYQLLGTGEHELNVYGSYLHERRDLDASFAAGDASQTKGSVNRLDMNAAYYFARTYGLTLGLFDITGKSDQSLYNTGEADVGSINGSPDTRGYVLQADWTPWGKADSPYAPSANLRLGLQYTGYDKFNGTDSNYDGFGRSASDNDTLYGFAWLSF
ncbi:MAG: cytochrome C [Gammaproteobacteria bacterium]|nr:cytochrome C [Gammaproteobacteria bacterium]